MFGERRRRIDLRHLRVRVPVQILDVGNICSCLSQCGGKRMLDLIDGKGLRFALRAAVASALFALGHDHGPKASHAMKSRATRTCRWFFLSNRMYA